MVLIAGLLLVTGLWGMSARKHNRRMREQEVALTEEKLAAGKREAQLQAAAEKLTVLERQLREKEDALSHLRQELTDYKTRAASLETQLAEERKAATEKLALLEEAKEKLSSEFHLLANQIFEEKGKRFTEQNRASLDEVLRPVREQLGEFRKRVEEVHIHDAKDRASLREQLKSLQALNQQMNEEARNLTRALKGDKKVQGDWGELILETVLEQSGLRKGIEYTTQGGFRDDENRLRRPDVILNLPDGKHMIIDSKVSLVAYNDYMRAESDDAHAAALERHVQAIRQHIKELSDKDYPSLTGLNAPDFVFMFMPIEAAFMAAFQKDEKLFSDAFKRNIVVVTPTTLLATLRTVENIWRYERQNENARKIADKAGAVYDKLRGFLEDFEKIGSQLATVQKTYDGALGKLAHGRGNLIRQAEGFVELGVKVKKQLPKSLVHEANAGEPDDIAPNTKGN